VTKALDLETETKIEAPVFEAEAVASETEAKTEAVYSETEAASQYADVTLTQMTNTLDV